MASKTRVTELQRFRKQTKRGKKRKRRIRKYGTTPPLLPTNVEK